MSSDNEQIESLRAATADESLAPEKRAEAARLLAELEKPAPAVDIVATTLARIEQDYRAYLIDQNDRFKVCGRCYRKQSKEANRCELCGARSGWEFAETDPPNPERSRLIAAATTYTDDELNEIIAKDSMSATFISHCARILELRGVPRVRSFWERAGFDINGHPVA